MLTPRDIGILGQRPPFVGVSDLWESEVFSDSVRNDYFDPSLGAAALTLTSLTLAASGHAVATGTLAKTLTSLTLAASGHAVATGSLAKTLTSLTLAASGHAVATGSLAETLTSLTSSALGHVVVRGVLAETLTSLTLLAHDPFELPYHLHPTTVDRTVSKSTIVDRLVVITAKIQ